MSSHSHVRRCHCCDHVTVRTESISRCEKCKKSFAPFFYFQEADTPIPTEFALRPLHNADNYRPIQGLTARWETS